MDDDPDLCPDCGEPLEWDNELDESYCPECDWSPADEEYDE